MKEQGFWTNEIVPPKLHSGVAKGKLTQYIYYAERVLVAAMKIGMVEAHVLRSGVVGLRGGESKKAEGV
ncbi:MAG: hypothetical protein OXI87_05470 [Albidovulum sp.]|nr:hypothetical protein [Albidovulum sp.]MDE0531605.1 hypothetical protein [Albidovulum sp.]